MILAELELGARNWLGAASALGAVGMLLLVWVYARSASSAGLRVVCGLLKAAAIALVALCLIEPLYTGSRPKPGSNLVLVLADNSRSLQLADAGANASRAKVTQARLAESANWLTRLKQDYDVRQYAFDTTLRPMKDFAELTFDGEASTLAGSLDMLADRYKGRPIAGIIVFSDGNATDLADRDLDWKQFPPIYPVAVASQSPALDVAVTKVTVSQTNFETAPVTLDADVEVQGRSANKLVVRVVDETGNDVEKRTVSLADGSNRLSQRFLIRPQQPGVNFYHVRAHLDGEESPADGASHSREATLANNSRLAVVDRGGGPYRVLYVSGNPNWEFKFLRRALAKDDEVHLVGLVRVARKEPKFTFLGRSGEHTNPLFRGFGNNADEQVEQYDEPVLIRLGTEDQDELRGGFPKDAVDLFRYQAVILDDMEAAFFTQDQMTLLQQFVSQRGGSLLMLGGKGSFVDGGFGRTPIGEMLPVYLERTPHQPGGGEYRLKLTREGWLQPWIRLRPNESEENQRLSVMPAFTSLNRITSIKPGASVLAEVESGEGTSRPALVVQSFGRGRVGALLVGDLWRWELRRGDPSQSDLEKAWRQTVRWLVADVPQSVEVETRRSGGLGLAPTEIVVRARNKEFAPLDNAQVKLKVKTPDGREIEVLAESDRAAGEYRAQFAPRVSGAYRASVAVTAADGSDVGSREVGWAVNADTDEFRQLNGNRALLERMAADSQGEVIDVDGLDAFVGDLPNRKTPVVETWTYPLWHQWSVLALAMGCLVAEWGLRRWKGLP